MTKTILAMGQSNALGAGGSLIKTNAHSFVWNNECNVTTLANLGSSFVPPDVTANPFYNGKGNFLVSTAAYLSEMLSPAGDVRVILVATSGISIDQWVNASNVAGPMWSRMKAVLAAAGVTEVDALIWHQGESDDGTASTYATRMGYLTSRLQADGHITASTPIVLGECSWGFQAINTVLHSIANADDRIGIASIGSFHTFDGTHFADQFTPMIAATYARELSQLPGGWAGTWVGPVGDAFVQAAGSAVSVPNSTVTKVPVRPMLGNHSLINPDGSFSPNGDGVWEFQMQGYLNAPGVGVYILDETGRELWFGSWDTGQVAILPATARLLLHRSDKVWFGLRQSSGATVVANDQMMRQYNKFSARFLCEG